jgi:serine/threonine-protein kinase
MADELLARLTTAVGARYDISGEIGRGGMGVVYRAKDVRLRRLVAIKLLPPELAFREEVRSRFLREAQTAAQLSHPNVVPIYSVDEIDGMVFFVMALVEGESLATYLKREGRASIEFTRRILRDVADALAYAHTRSIVHRDIKPDNILMDRVTGRTLVSDFGIARAAEGDSRLTATGVAVGTPAYMSPEQAIGEREVDGRSDIYSLGGVGYQMLGGELPFAATNTPSMLMKHINQAPRPLRELRADLPAGLERGIEKALAKKPDQRWVDAAAFRDALSNDSVQAERPFVPAPPVAVLRQEAPPAPEPPAFHRAVRDIPRAPAYPPNYPAPIQPKAPPAPPWLARPGAV